MHSGNPTIRLTHLDALRGVAILMVVLFHAYARWGDLEPFIQDERLVQVFASSWLGVELFFAISGFVILMSLHQSLGFRHFIVKRWLRLFPAMLVASIFIYAASPFMPYRPAGHPSIASLVPGLVFLEPEVLSDLVGRKITGLEGAFWSLYVEVRFYLLAGFAFFVLRDRNLISVLAVFAAFVVSEFLDQRLHNEWIAQANGFLEFWGAPYYGWFLVGVFGYRYYSERRWNLLFAATAMGGFASYLVIREIGESRLLLLNLGVILFLFIGSLSSLRLAGALSNRVFLFLGSISYPLYLVHENFVTGNAIALFSIAPDINPAWLPVPFILAAIAVAYAIAVVETPLRSTLRKTKTHTFRRVSGGSG